MVGLPQGSVLGPLLYIMFTADLSTLLATCSLLSHSYADDVQSYVHCRPSEAGETVRLMVSAADALTTWLSSNRLRLNSSKTQYIWLGTRQQLAKLDLVSLANEFPLVSFSTSVRDLGVILDQELTFSKHILTLSRACYYQLRQLRVVTRSLSFSSASMLVHAFVCSRLDYCSSLYVGLPQVRLNCLNRVLRSAARLVGGISRFGHVSEFMRDDLHWLPLHQLQFDCDPTGPIDGPSTKLLQLMRENRHRPSIAERITGRRNTKRKKDEERDREKHIDRKRETDRGRQRQTETETDRERYRGRVREK